MTPIQITVVEGPGGRRLSMLLPLDNPMTAPIIDTCAVLMNEEANANSGSAYGAEIKEQAGNIRKVADDPMGFWEAAKGGDGTMGREHVEEDAQPQQKPKKGKGR